MTPTFRDHLKYSVDIQWALLKAEKRQEKLAELNEKDRTIVLIALNTIRDLGRSDSENLISSLDGERIVKHLNPNTRAPLEEMEYKIKAAGSFSQLNSEDQDRFTKLLSNPRNPSAIPALLKKVENELEEVENKIKATGSSITLIQFYDDLYEKLCATLRINQLVNQVHTRETLSSERRQILDKLIVDLLDVSINGVAHKQTPSGRTLSDDEVSKLKEIIFSVKDLLSLLGVEQHAEALELVLISIALARTSVDIKGIINPKT